MNYDNFVLIMLMIAFTVLGIAIGLTLAISTQIVSVHAQTTTTISPLNDPTSGLKFLDQKAYIYTVPPVEVQQQQQQNNNNGTIESIITAGIGSAIAYFGAKTQADRKHAKVSNTIQETVLPEMVKNKEATKELARVTYDMNPEQAAKITDAPAVKISTLTEDAASFAEKAAKTSLS